MSSPSRVPAGNGVRGGRFAAATHPEPDLHLFAAGEGDGDRTRCGMCGQFRARASTHRCPAPGLVPLSVAAARVLDACRAAGGRPLIVGGSVRDALVARYRGSTLASKGVDIEVYDAEPAALARELSAVGRVDEVGVASGSVCAGVLPRILDDYVPRFLIVTTRFFSARRRARGWLSRSGRPRRRTGR